MFDTGDFIDIIKENKCIWDKQENSHHDIQAIHVGWTNVARACSINFDEMDEKKKTEKIKELKVKWKNIRDHFRKKCIHKSGQAATNEKKYIYADVLEFLRPTMENRRTESNVLESEPEEGNISEDESEVIKTGKDSDVCVVDMIETPKRKKQKSRKRKTMSFEDNLLKMLEERKVEDSVSSYLMSLAPQIRILSQDKQNQIFIEFLQTIQKVSSTNPYQGIPPAPIKNINSWPIQHSTPTFYERSYNTFPSVINHHPNHINLTPVSSTLTSSRSNSPQSISAIPQYYDSLTNSPQTVPSPGSPSATPFIYPSQYYESGNTK